MSLEERLLGEKSRLFAIVRALKVDGLSMLDQAAVNVVRQRIKELPTPEEIKDREIDKPFTKKVARQVGDILHLMELYGKRDMEMRQRYVARTQLLPRYKVLKKEQGCNMKLEKSAAIREMVKVSSVLDEQGQAELSEKMLGCAKCAINDTLTKEELVSTVKAIEAAGHSDLVKEAGFWGAVKGLGKGMADVGKGMADWGKQKLVDPARMGGLQQEMTSIANQMTKVFDKVQPLVNSQNPTVKQTAINAVKILETAGQAWNQSIAAIKQMETTTPVTQPATPAEKQPATPAAAQPNWQDAAINAGWIPPKTPANFIPPQGGS